MTWAAALRNHVSRRLQDDLDVPPTRFDRHGVGLVEVDGVPVWVVVDVDTTPEAVRVQAEVVDGLRPTAAVLREVNELNRELRWVRLVLDRDCLVVSADLVAESVEPGELGLAVRQVVEVANGPARLLATVHGGSPRTLARARDRPSR